MKKVFKNFTVLVLMIALLVSVSVPVLGNTNEPLFVNLISNGNAETNDVLPFQLNKALVKDTTSPFKGTASYKCIPEQTYGAAQQKLLVEAGKTYRFSAALKGDSITTLYVKINTNAFNTALATSWKWYSVDWVADVTGEIAIQLYTTGNVNWYIDNIAFGVVPDTGNDLIIGGNFEDSSYLPFIDFGDVNGANCTVELATDTGYESSNSMKITTKNQWLAPRYYMNNLKAGSSYIFSADMKAGYTTAGSINIRYNMYYGGADHMSADINVTETEWKNVSGIITIPDDASLVANNVWLGIVRTSGLNDGATGYELYVDNISLKEIIPLSGTYSFENNAQIPVGQTIAVTFNNNVNATSAETLANYVVDNGAVVESVYLNGKTTYINLDRNSLTVGESYTLTALNIIDENNTQWTGSLTFTAATPTTIGAVFEKHFDNIADLPDSTRTSAGATSSIDNTTGVSDNTSLKVIGTNNYDGVHYNVKLEKGVNYTIEIYIKSDDSSRMNYLLQCANSAGQKFNTVLKGSPMEEGKFKRLPYIFSVPEEADLSYPVTISIYSNNAATFYIDDIVIKKTDVLFAKNLGLYKNVSGEYVSTDGNDTTAGERKYVVESIVNESDVAKEAYAIIGYYVGDALVDVSIAKTGLIEPENAYDGALEVTINVPSDAEENSGYVKAFLWTAGAFAPVEAY